MPGELFTAPLTVGRGILNAAERFPEAVAVEDGTRQLRYAELADRLRRIGAAVVAEYGLAAGDVVVLLSPNRLEYLEIVTGLAEAGLVVATLNPRLSADELRAIVDDCDPALALVDPALDELYQLLADDPQLPTLRLGESYETLLARDASPCLTVADEYAAFSICYTSGTTGRPKGVLLPHRSRALVCLASAIEYDCFGPGHRFLSLAPLFHGAGFAFALAAVSHGGTCVLHDGSDGESIVGRLEQGDIHGVFMVPTHFKRVHDLPDERFEGLPDRHALRAIISNAAALSPRFKQLTVERFGEGLLHETYGSTEGGIVTNMRPDRILDKPESVGTPFLEMEVQIRRPDGSPCERGEVGEIFARGPYTFIGYLNREEETAAALRDGWVTVQDLAFRDEQGFLTIVGRAKDMIVSGGVNVYPAEIEKVIGAASTVAEVAVVGLPDEEWGERIHAFIVPQPQATVDQAEIIARCRDALSSYKVPRGITLVSELPRNAAGKILKKELRAAQPAA
ncbi:MAG: class I adenylate-forming enzyme family protein [Pseudohaliea sp.]